MSDFVTSIRVDPELWKKVKIQAIKNNETATDLLVRALKKELEAEQ